MTKFNDAGNAIERGCLPRNFTIYFAETDQPCKGNLPAFEKLGKGFQMCVCSKEKCNTSGNFATWGKDLKIGVILGVPLFFFLLVTWGKAM